MQQGNVILESSVKWDTSIRDCHIFIKELLAAVISIERTLISHPQCKNLVLACHNTAACHVLRRFYSGPSDDGTTIFGFSDSWSDRYHHRNSRRGQCCRLPFSKCHSGATSNHKYVASVRRIRTRLSERSGGREAWWRGVSP